MAEQEPQQPQWTPEQIQAWHMRKLINDPRSSIGVKKLINEVTGATFPELEAQKQAEAVHAPFVKRMEETEARLIKREADLNTRELRNDLFDRGVITREAIPDVEKFQQERGIANFKDAAELYDMNRRAAEPRTDPMTPLMLPGNAKEDADLYNGRHTAWGRRKALEVINEIQRARGRR